MNYLGIDHGSKRIGLSFANFLNISMPLKPIIVINITTSIDQILNIINEKNINKIIIGWPIYNDKTNNQTRAVENFIKNLSNFTTNDIIKYNEELTTFQALEDFKFINKKLTNIKNIKKLRKSGKIDSMAATIMLQDYLNNIS